MPIAIIGMHRSGTSMVSRLANMAGLFIGKEADMLPATEHNQSGYWEPSWLCDLNDRILAELGGTWHAPPSLAPGWERRPDLEPLRFEGSRALEAHYGGHEPWGWKDPRTTLLLPLWRELVDKPKFVLCVRNPLDVAASVSDRDKIPLPHALALWHYYTETALRETRPDERIVVFYEQFFEDYRGALGPVLTFLGLKLPAESTSADAQMCRFVDSSLKHHTHRLDDVLRHPDIPDYTKALYESLVHANRISGPTFDASAVPLTSEAQWTALTEVVEREGRRHLSRENCALRNDSWERKRLDRILNSFALALSVSASRQLKRFPALYRLGRRAPDRVPAKPQSCPTE